MDMLYDTFPPHATPTWKELLFPFISSLHSLLCLVVGRLYIQLGTHIAGSTGKASEGTKSCWKLKSFLIFSLQGERKGEESHDIGIFVNEWKEWRKTHWQPNDLILAMEGKGDKKV